LTLVGRSTRHGPQHALGQFCSDFAQLPTTAANFSSKTSAICTSSQHHLDHLYPSIIIIIIAEIYQAKPGFNMRTSLPGL
jgi:hypothetical protein